MIIRGNCEDQMKFYKPTKSSLCTISLSFNTYFIYKTVVSLRKKSSRVFMGKGAPGVYSRSQGGASLKKFGKPCARVLSESPLVIALSGMKEPN